MITHLKQRPWRRLYLPPCTLVKRVSNEHGMGNGWSIWEWEFPLTWFLFICLDGSWGLRPRDWARHGSRLCGAQLAPWLPARASGIGLKILGCEKFRTYFSWLRQDTWRYYETGTLTDAPLHRLLVQEVICLCLCNECYQTEPTNGVSFQVKCLECLPLKDIVEMFWKNSSRSLWRPSTFSSG